MQVYYVKDVKLILCKIFAEGWALNPVTSVFLREKRGRIETQTQGHTEEKAVSWLG